MNNIVRLESIKIIDSMKLHSIDIVADGGIASKGVIDKHHNEIYLVLFNKWKILIKKI